MRIQCQHVDQIVDATEVIVRLILVLENRSRAVI